MCYAPRKAACAASLGFPGSAVTGAAWGGQLGHRIPSMHKDISRGEKRAGGLGWKPKVRSHKFVSG